ncbi:MAG: hypothetical protein ABI606_17735 [Rhodoferax sp.]
MNPHNTQQLFDAFPHLYRGRQLPASESAMSWGFECGDGWFDLIWQLSKSIEDSARHEGIDPQSDEWAEATQVKNKFGSLREAAQTASQGIVDVIDSTSPKD